MQDSKMHTIRNYLAWPYARRSLAERANYDISPIKGMAPSDTGLGSIKGSQEFYRLTLINDNAMPIHSDWPMATTTALLYLNEPNYCYGGTAFWRHIPSGLDRMPEGASAELLSELSRDGSNPELWDLVSTCEMEFNKLLLFDSRLFHSPYPAHG